MDFRWEKTKAQKPSITSSFLRRFLDIWARRHVEMALMDTGNCILRPLIFWTFCNWLTYSEQPWLLCLVCYGISKLIPATRELAASTQIIRTQSKIWRQTHVLHRGAPSSRLDRNKHLGVGRYLHSDMGSDTQLEKKQDGHTSREFWKGGCQQSALLTYTVERIRDPSFKEEKPNQISGFGWG